MLQANWNYEGMQNLGFAWCMKPWIHRLYKKSDPQRYDAMNRQLEFFNTQPYMVGLIIGVVGRLEEQRCHLGKRMDEQIKRMKSTMGASLAAIGDKMFWGTCRPLCGIMALGLWVVLRTWSWPPLWVPVAMIFAYLVVFNVPSLILRWKGIRLGYQWGEIIALEIGKFHWQRNIRQLRHIGFILSLMLMTMALFSFPINTKTFLLRIAALIVCFSITMLRLPVLREYALVLALGFVIAWSGFL